MKNGGKQRRVRASKGFFIQTRQEIESMCAQRQCTNNITQMNQSCLEKQWGLCEYVIVHTILPASPVLLGISLDGKPKWLPLKWRYNDVMHTSPICWYEWNTVRKGEVEPATFDRSLSKIQGGRYGWAVAIHDLKALVDAILCRFKVSCVSQISKLLKFHSDSQDTLLYARFDHSETACFMNENKKILDGHLPMIPQPRFLHHGFRQPLALCMRKKNFKKPFPPWVRAVSKIYNSIGSMYPYERGSVSTVVCHLFVARVLERSAVCSQALCVVSGEASANFRTTVTESFLFGFSPTSHPRLANDKAFATVYLFLKLGIHWLQTKPRKVRLVAVVFSRRGERRSAG